LVDKEETKILVDSKKKDSNNNQKSEERNSSLPKNTSRKSLNPFGEEENENIKEKNKITKKY